MSRIDELKPCPFCGKCPRPSVRRGRYAEPNWKYVGCSSHTGGRIPRDTWNYRPLEDALNARIAELEAKISAATSGLKMTASCLPDTSGIAIAIKEAIKYLTLTPDES